MAVLQKSQSLPETSENMTENLQIPLSDIAIPIKNYPLM